MPEPQIMIIEDEKPLLLLYRFLLEKQGYRVLIAADGREAMQLLAVHTPSLIFLDMRLPYVSGLQVLGYIRTQARFQQTRVIANSCQKDYQFEPQVDEFIQKPLLPQTVKLIASETLSSLTYEPTH